MLQGQQGRTRLTESRSTPRRAIGAEMLPPRRATLARKTWPQPTHDRVVLGELVRLCNNRRWWIAVKEHAPAFDWARLGR